MGLGDNLNSLFYFSFPPPNLQSFRPGLDWEPSRICSVRSGNQTIELEIFVSKTIQWLLVSSSLLERH